MASRALTLLLLLILPVVVSAQGLYQEGHHYHRIASPQPTEVAEGKVEVVEVFSYACVHCASFEPFISAWKQSMPAQAQFRAVPAVFSPAWEPYARAYYAAEAMKVLDKLHQPLFKALHQDRQRLVTIEHIAEFAAQQGIDREEFLRTATSTSTNLKLRRAQDLARGYGIEGTPTLIVNGKYRVPTTMGFQGMLEVVDYLVAQEAGSGR
jgi:protein dithiol oxidoreductase (disulfide-forming)